MSATVEPPVENNGLIFTKKHKNFVKSIQEQVKQLDNFYEIVKDKYRRHFNSLNPIFCKEGLFLKIVYQRK